MNKKTQAKIRKQNQSINIFWWIKQKKIYLLWMVNGEVMASTLNEKELQIKHCMSKEKQKGSKIVWKQEKAENVREFNEP